MSSTEEVKSETSSGLSANVIMKNSSCGLAVLKNSITASRARSILLLMLPLMSKITPIETGASSLEKCRDLLLVLAFKELEVLFVEAGDQAVHGIRNRDRHQNQVHVDLEGLGVGLQRRINVVNGIRLGRLDPRRDVNVVDWTLRQSSGRQTAKGSSDYNQAENEDAPSLAQLVFSRDSIRTPAEITVCS